MVRLRKLALKLLICVCSTLVGLGLCEIAFRLMGLAPAVRRITPGRSESMYRYSKNLALGYVFREGHGDGGFPYINSHGQRDIERSYAKPPGRKRILLLGDSVVANSGRCRLDDVISRQLEKLYGDEDVEVLNFGVDGYCTRAEVELLKVRGIKYRPDVVILMFVNNDYFNINEDMHLVPFNRPKLVEWLFIRSHLFRFLCLKLNWFGFYHQQGFANLPWRRLLPNRVLRPTLEEFQKQTDCATIDRYLDAIGEDNVENGVQLLKELALEHGFRVLIGIWPQFRDDEIVDIETHGMFNYADRAFPVDDSGTLAIEEIARRNGIPTFRFSRHFRAHWKAHPSLVRNPRTYYTEEDGLHPVLEGARVAAEALKAQLDSNPEYFGQQGAGNRP